jgi:signal transduction histidine kinase
LLKAAGPTIEETEKLVREIAGSIRGTREALRPSDLDDFGLPTALRNMAEDFSRRTGIRVSVHCSRGIPRLQALREMSLFRISQEALTNISRHSEARRAEIRLALSLGKLRLSIRDDGKGFDPGGKRPRTDSGWGLTIMRERAEMCGGTFRVDSTSGKGTYILVELGGDRCRSGS